MITNRHGQTDKATEVMKVSTAEDFKFLFLVKMVKLKRKEKKTIMRAVKTMMTMKKKIKFWRRMMEFQRQ